MNLSSIQVVENTDFGNLGCFFNDKGEIAVEKLQIDNNVVTAEGKLEPMKWIAYQTV